MRSWLTPECDDHAATGAEAVDELGRQPVVRAVRASSVRRVRPSSSPSCKPAAAGGRRVKVVGAGHSFTPHRVHRRDLVDLSDYDAVVDHDPAPRTVTVQAGIPLPQLCDELDRARPRPREHGRHRLPVDRRRHRDRDPRHRVALRQHLEPHRRPAARSPATARSSWPPRTRTPTCSRPPGSGVGALGIVSTVTIQAVPAFRLHAIEEPMPVDEVLADFDGFMSSADHVEFYWVPHTRWALTKRNRRTDEPAAPRRQGQGGHRRHLLTNVAFGALCRIGRRRPRWIPRLAKILPSHGHGSSTPIAATRSSPAPARCSSTRWSTPSRATRCPRR